MTLEQLDGMSNMEYVEWAAFYKYERAMQDMETRKARHGR